VGVPIYQRFSAKETQLLAQMSKR